MNKIFIFLSISLFSFDPSMIFSHEGHKVIVSPMLQQENVYLKEDHTVLPQYEGRPQSWTQWIGGFHCIFLHFPITLIVMTVISELLFSLYKRAIFDDAARFMVLAAAILATPTAFLGLMYRYTTSYEGILTEFAWWHMWFGFATAMVAILVAFLRERSERNVLYYSLLFSLFLLVNVTGFLGGGLTLGPYHLYPPL